MSNEFNEAKRAETNTNKNIWKGIGLFTLGVLCLALAPDAGEFKNILYVFGGGATAVGLITEAIIFLPTIKKYWH